MNNTESRSFSEANEQETQENHQRDGFLGKVKKVARNSAMLFPLANSVGAVEANAHNTQQTENKPSVVTVDKGSYTEKVTDPRLRKTALSRYEDFPEKEKFFEFFKSEALSKISYQSEQFKEFSCNQKYTELELGKTRKPVGKERHYQVSFSSSKNEMVHQQIRKNGKLEKPSTESRQENIPYGNPGEVLSLIQNIGKSEFTDGQVIIDEHRQKKVKYTFKLPQEASTYYLRSTNGNYQNKFGASGSVTFFPDGSIASIDWQTDIPNHEIKLFGLSNEQYTLHFDFDNKEREQVISLPTTFQSNATSAQTGKTYGVKIEYSNFEFPQTDLKINFEDTKPIATSDETKLFKDGRNFKVTVPRDIDRKKQ